MTAIETFERLYTDIEKTLTAILKIRTIADIQNARKMPGYVYQQETGMREYWIALGQYTFSANLSYLSNVINSRRQVLPADFQTRQDLVNFFVAFKNHQDEVLGVFNEIINAPNILFIGYTEPITMEEYLQTIVININEEALNLEYNYKMLVLNQGTIISN